MTEFTFVHAADLHLDAPFRGLFNEMATQDSANKNLTTIIKSATFIALQRLVKICQTVRADFLILSGDIYNSADNSLHAQLALHDAFVELQKANIKVLLAHGNHDPLEQKSRFISWPDNVISFTDEMQAHLVFQDKTPIALVHGISHPTAKETRNLAQLFSRKSPYELAPEAFQIGVLHCALSGSSNSHTPYAPCTVTDLAAAQLDYWALGHVHSCIIRSQHQHNGPAQHPYYAYPGSMQGLHVNENGPHGCLVVRVTAEGKAIPHFVSLAPLQWESLTVSFDEELKNNDTETETLSDLKELLLRKLDRYMTPSEETPSETEANDSDALRFAHSTLAKRLSISPDYIFIRLELQGRTLLNHELRKFDAATALRENLNKALEQSNLRIHDIIINTQPHIDTAILADRLDLIGETYRLGTELQSFLPQLEHMAEQTLAPLYNRPKVRNLIAPPDTEQLADMMAEAQLLCLDLLEAE